MRITLTFSEKWCAHHNNIGECLRVSKKYENEIWYTIMIVRYFSGYKAQLFSQKNVDAP